MRYLFEVDKQIGIAARRAKVIGIRPVFAILVALLVTSVAAAQNPVIDWNAIAVTTALSGSPTISPASTTSGGTSIYLAYVHLAMYNAVNAIDHRFQSYGPDIAAPAGASLDAAAVAAAYNTLVYYFPDQAAALGPQYTASIAAIPDGAAKTNGIQVGKAAADAIIMMRLSDGRGADVPYTYPTVPTAAVWIPTPPALLPPQTPWVGQMTPLTMRNASQFLPDEPPPSLTSEEWADDFNQTRILGAVNSTLRSAQQTEIGLFWTEQTSRQYARAFRALAVAHSLDISDTARLFAMVWTSFADSFIGCMNAKYHFSFWRPVTAIRNAGLAGNPATVGDPTWTPLAATPNHPEFPAAHGCVTGAVARTLAGFFKTPEVMLVVSSTVTKTTHTFTNVRDLEKEVLAARIYAGFHYHHSLVEGFELGHNVTKHMFRNFFRPLNGEDEDSENDAE
jgi:hypothetical protein